MKILYVVNNASFFCSHRLPIALAARAARHEVALATGGAGSPTLEEEALRELRSRSIPHHVVAFTSGGTTPVRELRGLWQLYLHVRRLRPMYHGIGIAAPIYLQVAFANVWLFGPLLKRWLTRNPEMNASIRTTTVL
jgi:hypothetical protein